MSPSTSGPVVGDAVADDLVHRGAQRLGEAVVVERARVAAPVDAGLVADGVELVGGDAGPDGGAGEGQHLGRRPAGDAHALDHVRATAPGPRARRTGLPGVGVGRPRRSPPARRVGLSRPGADVGVGRLVAALELLAAPAPARVVGLEHPVARVERSVTRTKGIGLPPMAVGACRRSSRSRRSRVEAIELVTVPMRLAIRCAARRRPQRSARCCSCTSGPARPRAGRSARRAGAHLLGRVHRRAPSWCCATTCSPGPGRARPATRSRLGTHLDGVRGHPMARAALELAVLDAQLRGGRSLAGGLAGRDRHRRGRGRRARASTRGRRPAGRGRRGPRRRGGPPAGEDRAGPGRRHASARCATTSATASSLQADANGSFDERRRRARPARRGGARLPRAAARARRPARPRPTGGAARHADLPRRAAHLAGRHRGRGRARRLRGRVPQAGARRGVDRGARRRTTGAPSSVCPCGWAGCWRRRRGGRPTSPSPPCPHSRSRRTSTPRPVRPRPGRPAASPSTAPSRCPTGRAPAPCRSCDGARRRRVVRGWSR